MFEVLEAWIDHLPPGRALDLGAGDVAFSLWLAQRGFEVDAIEIDEARFRALKSRARGTSIRPILADMRSFDFGEECYALILASASLHFLAPCELAALAPRLTAALAPGGIFITEVFSTDDPARQALYEAGMETGEPQTFLGLNGGVLHFFTEKELMQLFPDLVALFSEASRRRDPEEPAGYRAGLTFVARRPSSDASSSA